MHNETSQMLVLGAGLNNDGTPSPQTTERGRRTYTHYDEHGASQVVFSGGHPILGSDVKVRSSEASIMADIAVDAGLPADLVKLEERSTTMLSNYINSAPILGPEAIDVIVHRLQARRALFIGERLLFNKVDGVEIEEPADTQRQIQERLLLAVVRLTLTGIRRGAVDSARVRNERVEAFSSKLARPIRNSILRDHTALGG